MDFKLRNLTKKDHLVEFKLLSGGMFETSPNEKGAVTVDDDETALSACLSGLKGPVFTCSGAVDRIVFTDYHDIPAMLYLDGGEIDLTGPGTLIDKIRLNTILQNIIEVELSEDGFELTVFNISDTPHRIAIVSTNGDVNWSYPSELPNTSGEIIGDQVTFCLSEAFRYTLITPSVMYLDEEVSIEMYYRGNVQSPPLTENDFNITASAGSIEIVSSSYWEGGGIIDIKPTSLGQLDLVIKIRNAPPEIDHRNYDVIERPKPVLNLPDAPALPWFGGDRIELPLDLTFSDGTLARAGSTRYTTVNQNVLLIEPSFVTPGNKAITCWGPGTTLLNATAIHDATGDTAAAIPLEGSVWFFDDIPEFVGTVGETKVITLGLNNIAALPLGWTTQLVASTNALNPAEYANGIADLEDPLVFTFEIIASSYGNPFSWKVAVFDELGVKKTERSIVGRSITV